MRLWRRSRSRLSGALDVLAHRDGAARAVLLRGVSLPFTTQDVAAALLGGDLWYEPLREYRDYLIGQSQRPHLWGCVFEASGTWPSQTWRSLSLSTRMARARIGPLARESDFVFAPSAVGLPSRALAEALEELGSSGLVDSARSGVYRVYAVATPGALEIDLKLVEIIAHWLRMLAHADEVAADRTPSGYEVYGYEEACERCRVAWGIRPRSPDWIPPFHPGCRCFAQPRFARTKGSTSMEDPR